MVGKARKQESQAEYGKQRDGEPAAVLVGLSDPAAADGSERRHQSERQRHACEQRQTAAYERLIGARKDERQHRQNARAEDRQGAAEVGKNDE
jgi:hypothetical protein